MPGRGNSLLTKVKYTLCLVGALVIVEGGAGEPIEPLFAVIYPELGDPYNKVFSDIIKGIEDHVGRDHVRPYGLGQNSRAGVLVNWLRQQGSNVVITLGRRATKVYGKTGYETPQIIGALDLSPQTRRNISGISLSVDPDVLFSTLNLLMPNIKVVYTLYDPERHQWIIDDAMQKAKTYELKLRPLKAKDLETSTRQVLNIIRIADPKEDAIWLPMDSTLVDSDALLPIIVEESWERHLAVFSTNLLHANMGVLFGIYPDNKALGESLARVALRVAEDPAGPSIVEPLRNVNRALNLRVASHLKIPIGKSMQRKFDLILPK